MRLRRWLLLASLLLGTGCAQLPRSDLIAEWRNSREVRLAAASGPLSPGRSAAIIEALRARVGDLDILQRHIAVEEAVAGSPLIVGNKVELLRDGPATYKAMLAAIRQATDHINLESYLIDDDQVGNQFADVLLERRARGVTVNLIYDSVGGIDAASGFFERLRKGGVNVLEFNPINPLETRGDWRINNRDHRKLLIVDGKSAFIGGINISRVYSQRGSLSRGLKSATQGPRPWRDTDLRIEGPVVAEFQKLFIQTWNQQRGEPLARARYFPPLQAQGKAIVRALASTPEAANSPIYLTLLSAIGTAEKKVYITMAYFVPDPQLLRALTDAARRGVDVRLLLPGHSDFWAVFHAGRSHYGDLLDAGVKVYERNSVLLHAKTAVIDGVWSCIGSANMDWRSFLHNQEANAVVLGPDFARQMEAMFDRDLLESSRVTLKAWRRRPLLPRLQEWTARLWEYWL